MHVEDIIIPRTHDIGNFEVRRALPSKQRRMVGPFIFWDQMGPGEFLTGQGIDVRPHPHIGLATLSYLFDGSLFHRDSLGITQNILPGDINLMTSGKGISHSERTDNEARKNPSRLFGIQSWLALPMTHEECDPNFLHLKKDQLPTLSDKGLNIRLIAGEWLGLKSPMAFPHDTLYADIKLKKGQRLEIPTTSEERALYALSGKLKIYDTTYDPMQILILAPQQPIVIEALSDTHVMLLGGAVMDSPRHIWWNFVASTKERIENAKEDWKKGRFAAVPGENEFIPLPE